MLEIADGGEGRHVLVLAGELDIATVPTLVERARPLVEEGGDVTLNLSAVSFVDSQGIRAFIQLARSLEGRGRLVLTAPSDELRKLFDIVRVDDFPSIVVET